MRAVTLCFLIKDDHVCLAMKKRGFGVGKWNGMGGKVGKGESIEEAAVRELNEEVGVSVSSDKLENMGNIEFYFNDNPDWNQHMHIYFAHDWQGEPVESEEMLPKWYKKKELPFKDMWVDDQHWLPKVLSGKKIEGKFYFKGDGGELDRFEVRELAMP